jgi:hypothetical protein
MNPVISRKINKVMNTLRLPKFGLLLRIQFYIWLAFIIFNAMLMIESDGESHGLSKKKGYEYVGDSIWFTTVTHTTVGYGDINAITPMARFVSLCHMIIVYFSVLSLDLVDTADLNVLSQK